MNENFSGGGDRPLAGIVETAFTIALVLFSIFYIWQSTTVTEPPRTIIVGPRTFPLLVGCMMLILSAALLWQRLRRGGARHAGETPEAESIVVPLDEDETSISDWPAVWSVLGFLAALFLLLEPLGFVLSISMFLFGLSTLFAPRQWLLNLVTGIAFSLLFYYLFTRVLGIPLPNGILALVFR